MPALPFDLHPLIAEAKRRARRRRFLIAALALALAGVAVATVLTTGAGGNPGVVPWLPTRPSLGPANPPLASPCTASQLQARLLLQGEAGTLAGGVAVTNRSSQPCALVEKPRLSFAGATSKWRVTHSSPSNLPALDADDPLAPPPASLRALAPGRSASAGLDWSNWCGRGSNYAGDSGRPPTGIVLTAPGGGRIVLRQNEPGIGPAPIAAPPCDGPAPSRLDASTRFVPYVPQLGPSSELPLKVRIVPNGSGKTAGFVARPGSWLSYIVVLTNRSRREFAFGRSCPAYTESIDFPREQAYVLNCRAIGAIAPRASVRFAMRIWVPRDVSRLDNLSWTLAPHTWKAPWTTVNVLVSR